VRLRLTARQPPAPRKGALHREANLVEALVGANHADLETNEMTRPAIRLPGGTNKRRKGCTYSICMYSVRSMYVCTYIHTYTLTTAVISR